jgi:oxalate decarboxylase/phosphoglucose isomerase-like protein (cupin superfamily)
MVPDDLDPVQVAPHVYSLIHEDERVRVLEMKLAAGTTDGLHMHPDEAVYFIRGSKVRIHLPDGESVDMDIPDGAPLSHESWTHTVENIGDSDLHAVVVEFKADALKTAGSVPPGMAATETSPDVYSILFEDDRIRMIEMKLPAGSADVEHSHPSEVAYFLKGGKVRLQLPDGNIVDAEISDGGVLSNPAWTHAVQNTGETDIHAIIVELKEPAM